MSLTPLSHFIIALSDAYHQYNPFFIKDIKELVVLNGFDCILTIRRKAVTSDCAIPYIHVLPVSKCELVGIVRYCRIRGNGSISLIIDDGSGVIDTIFWTDTFSLNENIHCSVGDLVRLRGNINVLSLKEKRTIVIDGKSYEGRTAIREIYITSLRLLEDTNEEALHWLQCLQFRKRLDINNSGENSEEDLFSLSENILNLPVLNGLETFHLLPNDIQNQILSQENNTDNTASKDWHLVKYYGRSCKCSMKYKEKLLYCHCIASKDENDEKFVFRDALLELLIQLELIEKIKSSKNTDAAETNSYAGDTFKDHPSCIQFEFSGIFQNPYLQSIAKKVTKTTTDGNNNVLRLFKSTFRALRRDGIVYLHDVKDDIYLLLSRDSVLVPTLINQLIAEEQFQFQLEMSSSTRSMQNVSKIPSYMESLPHNKLQLVRRLAAMERKKMDL
jgi:hypothetical protein